jgi:hypothetical protein
MFLRNWYALLRAVGRWDTAVGLAALGPVLFGLAESFIVIARQRSTGRCNELGTAAVDEIPGLRKDALQDVENLAHPSFPVDEFRKRLEKGRVLLDRPGRAQRPGSWMYFVSAGCHMTMLHLFEAESKGADLQLVALLRGHM